MANEAKLSAAVWEGGNDVDALMMRLVGSPQVAILGVGPVLPWCGARSNSLVSPQEPLLASVKGRKLAWFGDATRHDSLSKTIPQDALEGGRRRGRQRKCWMDNIKE